MHIHVLILFELASSDLVKHLLAVLVDLLYLEHQVNGVLQIVGQKKLALKANDFLPPLTLHIHDQPNGPLYLDDG